jgi:SAM-dependent methyltransferase
MTDPATIYEAWFVPAVFAPLARQVLDQRTIPPRARVLDVACGTGIVARTIAARPGVAGRVVGLDLNPEMLDVARQESAAAGLPVEWRQGSAQELPFENGAFDLVVCQQGLQFFPDKLGAVSEMYRVLAPHGEAILVTWRGLDQNPFFAAFERAVRRNLDTPAIEIAFSLGDPAALGALLLDAGFANVTVEPIEVMADYGQPDRFVEFQVNASAAAIPALQALDVAERAALIAAIADELAEPLREATCGDRLRFPLQGIVAWGSHP